MSFLLPRGPSRGEPGAGKRPNHRTEQNWMLNFILHYGVTCHIKLKLDLVPRNPEDTGSILHTPSLGGGTARFGGDTGGLGLCPQWCPGHIPWSGGPVGETRSS